MYSNYASRIKELRLSHNLTQRDFATSIGTSQNALSGYENKDRVPSCEILISIATTYNVSLDWLCGLSDNKSSTNIMSTYSDVIRVLTSIVNTQNLITEIGYDTPDIAGDFFFGSDAPKIGAIRFNDTKITQFFDEWNDMLKLLKKGTIKNSLYELWLKDQLDKYNIPISSANQLWVSNLPDSDDSLPLN